MKTRFCPSPTGSMHLGNVRTALFSALYAKSNHGSFLLRIEDTDLARSEKKYIDIIKEDLLWLGIHWQEGPDHDAGNGPYFQSERQDIYEKYYQQLKEKGLIYPCFCSDQQLKLVRKRQLAAGQPPRYTGTCRGLTAEEVAQKIALGEKPVLRFHVPDDQILESIDFVKGTQKFNTTDIGDFIIKRTNGMPSFMYCNAIDDALMGVTHVVRGEDHLTNTPRQLMILEALGLTKPRYGHIGLILGSDGAPLSKRHGSSSIEDLRQTGILPQALLNYLARLGHNYESNQLMSFDELAAQFNVDAVSKAPARFDERQLMYWQKLAVAQLSEDAFWQWIGEDVHSIVPDESRSLFIKTISLNILSPDDALYWARILFVGLRAFDEEKAQVVIEAGRPFYEHALKALAQFGDDYAKICESLKEHLGVKGKALFLPLRIAVTGEQHGPELKNVFHLLGTSELEKRLSDVLAMF